jgi:hypothetical protein
MKTYQVTVYENRTEWKFEGKRHRENGPAIEWSDGTKSWHINGKLHRENGPAIEYADGSKYWYINGKRHRENGPAVENADGSKYWFINGEELTEEQFNSRNVKELSMDELEKILGHKVKIVKK